MWDWKERCRPNQAGPIELRLTPYGTQQQIEGHQQDQRAERGDGRHRLRYLGRDHHDLSRPNPDAGDDSHHDGNEEGPPSEPSQRFPVARLGLCPRRTGRGQSLPMAPGALCDGDPVGVLQRFSRAERCPSLLLRATCQ